MRFVYRGLALSAVIALLGPSAAAFASPVAPAGAPLKQHRTARLCSAVTQPGRAACFAIEQTDTVQPAGVRANTVSPDTAPAGYGPSTLAAAYNLDQTQGDGQVVAIVDAYDDPNAESDLAFYRAQYGLGPCTTLNGCFRKVGQAGSSTSLPAPDPGWAGEISLDLDMVSATCPKCHILLVEATTNNLGDLGAAVNRAVAMGAKYVSNSYGGAELSSEASLDISYYHHAGVAITASAGDSGYGAAYPATGAYVTAVGGTSLVSAGNARHWTETVWKNSTTQGTGSGCSAYVAKPAFQTSLTTSCGKRAETDVSAVADPATGVAVRNTYSGSGWGVYGGTSAASPIIASVYALAGAPGVSDNPNTYPYLHTPNLFDVTSGNNTSVQDATCTSGVLCNAGTGWDGPTGLGTPNGSNAFSGVHTVTVANPGTQTSAAGSLLSLQIHASDSAAGKALSYTVSGLPPGLALNSVTGLISGIPSTQGSYPVTATATDVTSAHGSTTFAWVVRAPGTVLGAPTAVTATRGDAQAVVSWAAPVSDGGSAITGYTVTAAPGGRTSSTSGPTTTTVLGLTNGTSYTFRVTATTATATSPASLASAAVIPLGPSIVFSPGDFTGDGKRDVLRVTSTGDLLLYRGSGTGTLGAAARIGGGWGGFINVFSPGDFTGDRRSDILAVKANGDLYLYRGNGVGGFTGVGTRIGVGWQNLSTMFSPGDFTGDGKSDVMGVTRATGDLYLYRGNGAGGWAATGQKIGHGWQNLKVMFSPRDFTGDGKSDVMGVSRGNGDLYLYPGNGTGGWLRPGTVVGVGWGGLATMFSGGDFTGDGRSDVLGTSQSGDLYLYRGNGRGGWLSSQVIASGMS